jgi:hypothetical protein
VDWNIGPESQAVRPLHFTMLVERAAVPVVQVPSLTPHDRRSRAEHWLAFFWAMVPIGVKFCGRGDTRRAVKQLDLQITAYIALWRLTSSADARLPPHSANPILEPALQERIPAIGPMITPVSVLAAMQALAVRVKELHPALASLGVAVSDELIEQVADLADLAARELSRGAVPTLKYR